MSRKITESDVLAAWRDAMAGDRPVLASGGMTVRELMKQYGLSYDGAAKRIRKLRKQGRVKQIGVRPMHSRPPVYELVGEKGAGRG